MVRAPDKRHCEKSRPIFVICIYSLNSGSDAVGAAVARAKREATAMMAFLTNMSKDYLEERTK